MKTDKPIYLYHILDHRGRIRYVGLSVKGAGRLKDHLHEARPENRFAPRPLIEWIRVELAKGRVPRIRVVRVAKADHFEDERLEIIRQRRLGHPVLNVVVRGDRYRSRNRWACKCGRITKGIECETCHRKRPTEIRTRG